MTEKEIDSSAGGFLILILPIAFLIVFLFATWPIILALVLLSAGFNFWQRYQWQKLSKLIDPIFNKLIQENRGCVTPLDLAVKANFSAQTAKLYLDTKAEEFGAQRRHEEGKGPVYYFITASTLGSILDDSEPSDELPNAASISTPPQSVEQQAQASPTQTVPAVASTSKQHSISLIQAELAKRLDVHSSTVYKRRADSDFPEWSRSRDPEGIAWKYSPETREFVPM